MTRHWFGRGQNAHSQLPRRGHLRLECLEDRAVPATFYVNTTLDDVIPGNGIQSLREAITRANDTPGADVIVVPAGVYKITINGAGENSNNTGDFDITDTLTIQGAGAGLTNIDGQQLDRVFDVFGTAPSSIKVVLQGLTIRNGNATGAGGGGGIRVGNADLVVRDCVVTGNRAALEGGGISNALLPGTGNVTIVRTIAGRNVAGGAGGGISVMGSCVLTIKDSTVRRNIANGGGGIAASTATLTNSTVNGNSASAGFAAGGIFANESATLTNCTVSGNSASIAGGIFAVTATLTNCTVSGNSAVGSGGGLGGGGGGGISAGTANLTNCTVSGNSAGDAGGGIAAGSATLLNCTVVENSAHTGGGLFHGAGGTFNVRNTIVALNLVDFTGTGPDVSGDFTSQGHNLIGDPTDSTGFTNGVNGDRVGTSANPLDPRLGPLQNNGGRTKTHALLAGSPAIDHGDNNGAPATDQRGFGFARKKDGNGDGIAIVDIGAFEK